MGSSFFNMCRCVGSQGVFSVFFTLPYFFVKAVSNSKTQCQKIYWNCMQILFFPSVFVCGLVHLWVLRDGFYVCYSQIPNLIFRTTSTHALSIWQVFFSNKSFMSPICKPKRNWLCGFFSVLHPTSPLSRSLSCLHPTLPKLSINPILTLT